MKSPKKRFRNLVIIGFTLVGTITFPLWLSVAGERQQQLDTDLLTALSSGQVQEVTSLLKEGADPNAHDLPDVKPGSLLQQIIALITQSHRLKYDRAPTALCYATDLGIGFDSTVHARLVKLLLDNGANVNSGEHCQRPPLFCASLYGETTAVQIMLDHGVDVNVRQPDGFTALRAAVMAGQPEIVRLLLDHGAQVQIQRDITGRNDLDWVHDATIMGMLKNASKTK